MRTMRVVRHSLTEGNEKRLYYGSTDLPLSTRGQALCKEKRGSFRQADETLLIHSGMLRARQTLEGVMEQGPVMVLPDLREMSMGDFEMKRYDELRDDPAYNAWISGHADALPIPGGESTAQVRERVRRALDVIVSLPYDDVFIVCHGGTVAHIMQALFPTESRTFYEWIPTTLEGYEIAFVNKSAASWKKL